MPAQSRRKSNGRNNSTTDAIALLKKDHQEVRKLLNQLERTTAQNGAQRRELLSRIENEIKAHAAIEAQIFYPAFKAAVRSTPDEELYYEAIEEHHVVDLVLPEVKRAGVESEKFAAKAKVLKDLIEHHVGEEEKGMFPKARKVMGAAELNGLGRKIQQRKQQFTTGGTLARLLTRRGVRAA
jgi:hemerythrin-like domain-containing protein